MKQRGASGDEQRAAETSPRRCGRLGALLTLAAVCVLLAGFGALALWRAGGPTTPLGTLGWRVYHDPLGLYTMRLPPGWTASARIGEFTHGDPQGSDSGRDESVLFSDPAQGAASASISVYAMPIHNVALAQRTWCASGAAVVSTFNGYPAEGRMPPQVIFNATSAHFQVDEEIPDVFEAGSLGHATIVYATPTPLPATTVAADRALLNDALASFQPTDPKPLTCP